MSTSARLPLSCAQAAHEPYQHWKLPLQSIMRFSSFCKVDNSSTVFHQLFWGDCVLSFSFLRHKACHMWAWYPEMSCLTLWQHAACAACYWHSNDYTGTHMKGHSSKTTHSTQWPNLDFCPEKGLWNYEQHHPWGRISIFFLKFCVIFTKMQSLKLWNTWTWITRPLRLTRQRFVSHF